ncbi:type II toxin-antitoxin system PemK/MazF family toxin [Tolypothrix sp. NIES-4075]|uniref:type II toxin-antitoxin system PemK/MazF family toxin n=1 Tax=Tolypothrix sp. NIES-4075 TaxID=2005459 RepID=UPI000B5D04A9|nr:type II toxin-antitoxin system PemK/MazF family toxin [Tolypothrix sp. NIES-4075]
MNLQRGDVVLCRVSMPSTQFQQLKIRPALVVSTDRLNQILDDVMVVHCTSNTNRPLTATQYLITGEEITRAGIRVEPVIRCESIFTLNKTMILRKLGSLFGEAINQVNVCLIKALEL